jgi:hypothetical protein
MAMSVETLEKTKPWRIQMKNSPKMIRKKYKLEKQKYELDK